MLLGTLLARAGTADVVDEENAVTPGQSPAVRTPVSGRGLWTTGGPRRRVVAASRQVLAQDW